METLTLDCTEFEYQSSLDPDEDAMSASSLQLDECSDDEAGSGEEEETASVEEACVDDALYFRSNRSPHRERPIELTATLQKEPATCNAKARVPECGRDGEYPRERDLESAQSGGWPLVAVGVGCDLA